MVHLGTWPGTKVTLRSNDCELEWLDYHLKAAIAVVQNYRQRNVVSLCGT